MSEDKDSLPDNKFIHILNLIDNININRYGGPQEGDVEKIKNLLENNIDLLTDIEENGDTIIHCSCKSISGEVLDSIYNLLGPEKCNKLINMINNDEDEGDAIDCLFSCYCCESDYDPYVLDCIKILIKCNLTEIQVKKIIENCIGMGFEQCLSFLLDYGFNPIDYIELLEENSEMFDFRNSEQELTKKDVIINYFKNLKIKS